MQPVQPVVSTRFESTELPLAEPFGISRNRTETTACVVVELEDDDGQTGIGSATPVSYYGETVESVEAVLPDLLAVVETVGDPHRLDRIASRLEAVAPDAPAARTAVSIAVHDLAAKQVGEPLYRRLGLDPGRTPPTSYTVGLATAEEMAERARRIRAAGFPVLKVKLGSDDDWKRLRAVRDAAPQATIRVDANGDWTAEETLTKCEWLAAENVEFVEQPVPAEDIDGLARVAAESSLPVAADESCVTAADVPGVAEAVDIVVVKLMKCGGVRPALRQIATANAHGLDVMVGCMVESMASLAAGCHLSPLAEYADLDGSLLLDADPHAGVSLRGGNIRIGDVATGTGATQRADGGTQSG